jgi:hypothetical protein
MIEKTLSALDACISYVSDRASSEGWDKQLAPALIDLLTNFKEWGGMSKHFSTQFCLNDSFDARLWEMVLARKLHKSGLEFKIGGDGEPDFFIKKHNLWIEAVCPKPSGIPQEFLNYPSKLKNKPKEIGTIRVPSTEILLRWTHAVKEKNKQAKKYFEKGIVKDTQGFIIAVCCSQLGRLPDQLNGQSGYPYPVEFGYGIGALTASFDKFDPSLDRIYNPARPNIEKESSSTNAEVPTAIFLDPDYNKISAVIGAYSGLSEVLSVKAEKFTIAHNPIAINKIDRGLLADTSEYNLNQVGQNVFEIIQVA